MACVEDATIDANEWACSEHRPINYMFDGYLFPTL